jgi:type III secretory pathway lipoprotein EscJ
VNGLKELGYPMQSAEEMAEIFQKLGLNSSTKVH